MGYTTDFEGEFHLTPALTAIQAQYLEQFARIRHMRRDTAKLPWGEHILHTLVDLPVGPQGEFYVGDVEGGSRMDDYHNPSILDYNLEPTTQPGLWCNWVPDEDGENLIWNGREKFYYYTEWLQWIIINILTPWGVVVDGDVEWTGEERSDIGIISVKCSNITVHQGVTKGFLEEKIALKRYFDAQVAQVREAANTPKVYSSEGYRVEIFNGEAIVSPQGKTAHAILLGQMILDGEMTLETRMGRTAHVIADFDYQGTLKGVRMEVQ